MTLKCDKIILSILKGVNNLNFTDKIFGSHALPLLICGIFAVVFLHGCGYGYEELPELTYPADTTADITAAEDSTAVQQTEAAVTEATVTEAATAVSVTEEVTTTAAEYTTAATNNPPAGVEHTVVSEPAKVVTIGLDDEKYADAVKELSDLLTPYGNQVGVVYLDLGSGSSLEYNADTRYPGASLVKAPFVKSILAAEPDLDMEIVMTEELINSASENLLGKPAGTAFTLRTVAEQTLKNSSNTGYNMLLDKFGYYLYNNMTWSLGINSILGDTWKYTGYTARQMTVYFKDIYYFTLSGEYGTFLKQCMTNPSYNALIGSVITDRDVAQKYGYMPDMDIKHNCAVVYGEKPYVICIMTRVEGQYGATDELIRDIAGKIDKLNSIQ